MIRRHYGRKIFASASLLACIFFAPGDTSAVDFDFFGTAASGEKAATTGTKKNDGAPVPTQASPTAPIPAAKTKASAPLPEQPVEKKPGSVAPAFDQGKPAHAPQPVVEAAPAQEKQKPAVANPEEPVKATPAAQPPTDKKTPEKELSKASPPPPEAAAGGFPLAAFNAQELAHVREWEKVWSGKKIDKTNVEQVGEFLPPSFVELYKHPETWGAPAEGLFFYITAYKQIIETTGMIEATKKYSPMVKMNTDGTMANYSAIAGMPFPNPKTGIEVAYNFDFNTHGDSAHYRRNVPNINPSSRTERLSDQEQWELFYIHRVDVDPKPALPNNEKGYARGIFLHMYKPPEFLNTRYYSLRFADSNKSDDMYLWYSQFRRIRRMSSTQRTDAIDGSDLIYDDEFFWDGHMHRNDYKLKGMKDILCTRHQDMSKTSRAPGQGIFNGLTYERCKLFVVDAVNKDSHYIYGRRVWYIDPETYYIMWTEIYDTTGRFWKCFINMTDAIKTVKGEYKTYIVGSAFEDFQRTHSGTNHQKVFEIGGNIDATMFTVNNLQRTY